MNSFSFLVCDVSNIQSKDCLTSCKALTGTTRPGVFVAVDCPTYIKVRGSRTESVGAVCRSQAPDDLQQNLDISNIVDVPSKSIGRVGTQRDTDE